MPPPPRLQSLGLPLAGTRPPGAAGLAGFSIAVDQPALMHRAAAAADCGTVWLHGPLFWACGACLYLDPYWGLGCQLLLECGHTGGRIVRRVPFSRFVQRWGGGMGEGQEGADPRGEGAMELIQRYQEVWGGYGPPTSGAVGLCVWRFEWRMVLGLVPVPSPREQVLCPCCADTPPLVRRALSPAHCPCNASVRVRVFRC